MMVYTHIRSHAKKRPAIVTASQSPGINKVKTMVVEVQQPPRAGSSSRDIPSLGDGVGVALQDSKNKTIEKEISSKYTVAPICSKGGYQVITNENDYKTMGRKV